MFERGLVGLLFLYDLYSIRDIFIKVHKYLLQLRIMPVQFEIFPSAMRHWEGKFPEKAEQVARASFL
jgi:hypothetical protein